MSKIIGSKEQSVIDDILKKHLSLNKEEHQYLLNNLITMFEECDEHFFLQMRYELLQEDSSDYAQKLLMIIFDLFTALHTDAVNKKNRDIIKKSLLKLATNLLIKPQDDRFNIYKRRDVVNSILHHMTNHLNEMLDTQKLTIANISHEMRTSLNAILGYTTQLVSSSSITGPNREYLIKLKGASSTLLELVNEILDITKINAGELDIKISNFWIDDLLSDVLNLAMDLEDSHHHISFSYDFDFFSHEVSGDRNRIFSVIQNLLCNAFKYTQSGEVHLKVKKETIENSLLKISFSVADTGPGMSDEQQKNIFKPFVRHNQEEQGVGLGLFIAQSLATNMGGSLSVKSRLEIGSEFVFTLTLAEHTKEHTFFNDSCLLFFIPEGSDRQLELYDKMKQNLTSKGANISLITDEKEFFHSITGDRCKDIDIISISPNKKENKKYNALIGYLKHDERFKNTLFVASFTNEYLDLNNFDQLFIAAPTMSSIIRRLSAKKMMLSKDNRQNQNGKSLKILAVDDIETNLEVLELFITNRYSSAIVDKALGGYEAIGMCKVQKYDLILMDLKMPGMSGYDVFKKLRSLGNDCVIYALTADIYDETVQKVKMTGFSGLLEKPIQTDTLYALIDNLSEELHHLSGGGGLSPYAN